MISLFTDDCFVNASIVLLNIPDISRLTLYLLTQSYLFGGLIFFRTWNTFNITSILFTSYSPFDKIGFKTPEEMYDRRINKSTILWGDYYFQTSKYNYNLKYTQSNYYVSIKSKCVQSYCAFQTWPS